MARHLVAQGAVDVALGFTGGGQCLAKVANDGFAGGGVGAVLGACLGAVALGGKNDAFGGGEVAPQAGLALALMHAGRFDPHNVVFHHHVFGNKRFGGGGQLWPCEQVEAAGRAQHSGTFLYDVLQPVHKVGLGGPLVVPGVFLYPEVGWVGGDQVYAVAG